MAAAVLAWVVLLAWMYRRSRPESRVRGLLVTAGWAGVTAPAAYYKMDGSVAATAGTAIIGAGIVALAGRGRFDTLLASWGSAGADDTADEDAEDPRSGRLGFALILLAIAALGVLIMLG